MLLTYTNTGINTWTLILSCYCCFKDIPQDSTKTCPACNHVFKGKGWEGLDAHWKAKHSDIMSYGELWTNMCEAHKSTSTVFKEKLVSPHIQSLNAEQPFQRVGSISNAHVGRNFESAALSFFAAQGFTLQLNLPVVVGVDGKGKLHSFDLGCEKQKILVECKSHRWTTGDNVPSAKMTVWNEAMYYFLAAPAGYRKIMFVLRDYSAKRKESLAEYYIRTYWHLIPSDVEIWEFDEGSLSASRLSFNANSSSIEPSVKT